MSRRAKKIEKRVTVDPKYNSELIAHIIRIIMKDGKKTTAEKIVYGAIEKIKAEVEKSPDKFMAGEGDQKAPVTEPLEIIPSRGRHHVSGSCADQRSAPAFARAPLDDHVRRRSSRHGHARRRRRRDRGCLPGPG